MKVITKIKSLFNKILNGYKPSCCDNKEVKHSFKNPEVIVKTKRLRDSKGRFIKG